MCYIGKYTAYTAGNRWTLWQQAAQATRIAHCTFQSRTRHRTFSSHSEGRGAPLPTPTRHSRVLTAHSYPPHVPFFFSFSFFSFSPLRRRHPPRKQLEVITSTHGTRLTHKTFKPRFFFCLLQFCKEKDSCLITQSVGDPPHTAHPTINILSAHAHGKGSGTTRRTGTSGGPGPPKHHTPRCSAASDMNFFALERPSQ